MIRYQISEQANFEDYLFVKTSQQSALFTSHEKMAREKYQSDYDDLISIDKRKEIVRKFPLILEEKWTP